MNRAAPHGAASVAGDVILPFARSKLLFRAVKKLAQWEFDIGRKGDGASDGGHHERRTLMRKFVTSVLAAATIAAPLHAAPWQDQGSQVRPGTFIGAQFKMPLGGPALSQPRAQLAFAPTRSSLSNSGQVTTRIGEGLALDFTSNAKPTLTLAGIRADTALRLTRAGRSESDRKLGISTAGWVAIGVGVVVIAAGGALLYIDAIKDGDEE